MASVSTFTSYPCIHRHRDSRAMTIRIWNRSHLLPIMLKQRQKTRIAINRSLRVYCKNCADQYNDDDDEPKMKQDKVRRPPSMKFLDKFVRSVRESMRPQRKGDWKDLMLMSVSFAVYVYVSQKIVCAYYAWVYIMPKQHWWTRGMDYALKFGSINVGWFDFNSIKVVLYFLYMVRWIWIIKTMLLIHG